MKKTQLILMALAGLLIISSCTKDEDPEPTPMKSINLNITGLEDLGPYFVY